MSTQPHPLTTEDASPQPAAPSRPSGDEFSRAPGFGHVDAWVFDLDNTLYPAGQTFFAEMDQRIERFIMDLLSLDQAEARRLRARYYGDYGATLNGLMTRHGVAPDPFLDFVHDVDVSGLDPCAVLRARIDALPGRKFIFTNSCRAHVDRVSHARGLTGLFDGVFDIAAADYTPKPQADAYHRFLDAHDVDPQRAAMFDDLPRNLKTPAELGFVTVHVDTAVEDAAQSSPAATTAEAPDHVHHHSTDLTAFLGAVHDALDDR